ncbi:MAG: Smr/MutS family protein [Rickettsiales bacterium]|nr:Smr/MutS family protein [Rickettsiales bacterium]
MSRRDLPPRSLTDEEQHLWHQTLHEVRPLVSATRVLISSPKIIAHRVPVSPLHLPDHSPPPPRHMPPMPQQGLDPQLKRRLRRGALAPQAVLDLHGLTSEEAFHQFAHFIEQCHRHDKRFVLVITGKGKMGTGKLREGFTRWLDLCPLRHLVQSFEPAQPRDGGSGAFYVKLRRAKE